MAVLVSSADVAGEELPDGSDNASADVDAGLPPALTGCSSTNCGSVSTLVAILQACTAKAMRFVRAPQAVKYELMTLEGGNSLGRGGGMYPEQVRSLPHPAMQ